MELLLKPKRHRYPASIISFAIWSYYRFNDNYQDVAERLVYRDITVSHKAIRNGCQKFGSEFAHVIKKRERKPTDKGYLDEKGP